MVRADLTGVCRHPWYTGTVLPWPSRLSSQLPATACGRLENTGDGRGRIPSLETIVRVAHDEGHSDVHLGVGEAPATERAAKCSRQIGRSPI